MPDTPHAVEALESLVALHEALTYRAIDREKRRYEAKLRRVVVRLFRAQSRMIERQFLPTIKGEFSEALSPNVEAIILLLLESIAMEYRQQLLAVLIAAASRAYTSTIGSLGLSISFDLPVDTITRILGEQAASLITRINETTREIVRALIVEGVEKSRSYTQVAKSLRDRFREFGLPMPQRHIRDRATLIAVTEVGNAYGEAQLQVGRDLTAAGLMMEKFWLTSRDERVTDGCRGNEGAGWIPLNDVFPSGHQRPLRFPGCRCAVLIRRKPN